MSLDSIFSHSLNSRVVWDSFWSTREIEDARLARVQFAIFPSWRMDPHVSDRAYRIHNSFLVRVWKRKDWRLSKRRGLLLKPCNRFSPRSETTTMAMKKTTTTTTTTWVSSFVAIKLDYFVCLFVIATSSWKAPIALQAFDLNISENPLPYTSGRELRQLVAF